MMNDFKEIKNTIALSTVWVNGLTIPNWLIIYMLYDPTNPLKSIIFTLINVTGITGNKFQVNYIALNTINLLRVDFRCCNKK